MFGAVGLALTAMWTVLNAGCGRAPKQDAVRTQPVAAVAVEIAERRDVPLIVELAARTEAAATVEIRANVQGRLTEMSFPEGNMVAKGQVLFRIDPRHYDAVVQSAQAVVEKAEADLEMAREQQRVVNAQSALRQAEANLLKCNQDVERLKPLAARKAVPQRDLDTAVAAQSAAAAAVEDARATVRTTTVGDRVGLRQAEAGLASAKAALQTAELDRAETEIRAPIGGLIGRADISVGNYVGQGDSSRLATVSQLDPIQVVFGISETLYLHTVDQIDREALKRIELTLADNSLYPYRGRYTNIGRAVDEKTGTLLIVAQFPNPKGILLPGMTGRVQILVGNRRNAVLIPERALLDIAGAKAVNVVTPGNTVASRNVTTEGSYQGKSIVTGGLDGGEIVIVEGGAKLRPGQPVSARTAPAGPVHPQ
jgi:membrane fusion protein (multidrug efflux system)